MLVQHVPKIGDGVLAHIGQTEYEAGFGGGQRMAAAGATNALCINQEVGNVALDLRCQGDLHVDEHHVVEDCALAIGSALRQALGEQYVVALNNAHATPTWLRTLGGKPMTLGLDLKGGVHFLMQVDMDTARSQQLDRYVDDLRAALPVSLAASRRRPPSPPRARNIIAAGRRMSSRRTV